MKNKLIGSAGSLEDMKKLLERYFYSKIEISAVNGGYEIFNSTKKIEGFSLTEKKGRFRFELLTK